MKFCQFDSSERFSPRVENEHEKITVNKVSASENSSTHKWTAKERVESEEIPSSYAEARLIHSIKMIDWIIKAFNNNFFFLRSSPHISHSLVSYLIIARDDVGWIDHGSSWARATPIVARAIQNITCNVYDCISWLRRYVCAAQAHSILSLTLDVFVFCLLFSLSLPRLRSE